VTQAPAPSLRSRLLRRLVPLQAALLSVLLILVLGTLGAAGFLLDNRDEDHVIEVVQKALTRDAAGQLTLLPTSDLQRLRSEIPDLWFVVRDRAGQSISQGAVPPEFANLGGALDHISQARLGWQLLHDDPRKPAARLKRVDTSAGNVQILTATQGKLTGSKAVLTTAAMFLGLGLPALVLMMIATFIATPMVVRRALAGLALAAQQAGQIDIHRRGTRLSLANVPAEIAPLVSAINDALTRLDQGYARQKRFVADAAHELRTPIAILNTRLESLPPGPDKTRLLEDVARLATLAEQLLDIQRLDQNHSRFAPVDLVAVGQSVTAELAPLAIAAGYEICFDAEPGRIGTIGDRAAIERALVNLVQNAIQHGGRRGKISISVSRAAVIEVRDQGSGVPPDQRGSIFEPFYRLQPLDRGAGLGLNLVREIAELHGGDVSVLDNPAGGACFRLALRPAAAGS
jgi:signal transduction histidine kinase